MLHIAFYSKCVRLLVSLLIFNILFIGKKEFIMGDKDIRVPKQQRSIEKKQRIKDTAVKLMSEKGYHSTSSNEIAKEADVSIGTFYSYFSDKKALYTELVADIYSVVLKAVA